MIERILAFSVRNRWLVLLLTLAASASGLWSLTRLPIDAVPDITNVQVQVNAFAPALSPLEIEKQVTFPIEVALAGIPGLENTWSFSRNGFAQITAVFSDKTDIYFARQQVAERLASSKANLPPNVDVSMGPISTGLGEVYWWSVEYIPPGEGAPGRDGDPGWQSDGAYLTPEGERLTDALQRLVYLRTVQDWIIRPQVKTVPGIAGADAIGGYVKQYGVQPDPARLVGYGVSFGQIVNAIEANNVSRGANYIERNGEGYVVRTSGRVERLAEIGDIVVATRGGVPVRVKDVAQVASGRELRTGSASVNGAEVVLGTALMLVGGNSRTVAAAADAKIKEVNRTLPAGIRARAVLNRTELVDATVHTVATNLALGALLVVLVLFLMLGNFRAALITAMVIPITMLITTTGMLEGKISANLMSLGALDFGLIVDGAIIIAENCLRHLSERRRLIGRPLTPSERLETVAVSSQEVIQPTIYGQAVIVLVYVPLLGFSGVEGKTFLPMALTVIIALGTAFVLSLTFVPAMLAVALSGNVQERENRVVRGLKGLYQPALAKVIQKPLPIIASAVAMIAVAGLLFTRLGQEFVPILDEKNIVMEVKRIPSASLAQSQAMQFANEELIAKLPQVAFVFSRSGTPDLAADPMPPSATDTYIILKPRKEWPDPDLAKDDLLREISEKASRLPGNKFDFSQPIQMRFNELIAGRERGSGDQGVRGRVRADAARGQPDCRHPQQDPRRRRGQGGGRDRNAGPGNRDRQSRDRTSRPEPFCGSGRARHRHRRTRGGTGLRRRPAVPDRRPPLRRRTQRCRSIEEPSDCPAGDDAGNRRDDDSAAATRQFSLLRRAEPNQPGQWKAPRRRHRQCTRTRHGHPRRRGAGQDFRSR